MEHSPAITQALAAAAPRLKRLRTERGVTLSALSEATGISKSTLSRLETGQRRPSLELLLPIARAHQVPLDELVGAPDVVDPRLPHWFGSAGEGPVEILSLFGREGERMHVRARPRGGDGDG